MPAPDRRLALLLLWTSIAVVPPALAGEPAAAQAATAEAAPAAEDLLPNGRRPAPELLTGGQPSPEQLEAIAAAGYRTIVDLRPEGEPGAPADEAARAAALGLAYVRIPVAGAGELTEEKVRALDLALDAAEDAGPVVVHCATGNRVGALLALRAALLDGVPPDAALEMGLGAGLTKLEPVVREMLGLPVAEPAVP